MDDGISKDLDETRRLLYMTLAVPRVGRYAQIVGTAVNALAHHEGNLGVEPYVALSHLDHVINDNLRLDNLSVSEMWVKEQISALTTRLDEADDQTD